MFYKYIDFSENSKQCGENAEKHCQEMQPEIFNASFM